MMLTCTVVSMVVDYLPPIVVLLLAAALGWHASAPRDQLPPSPGRADSGLAMVTGIMLGSVLLASMWGGLSSFIGCPGLLETVGLCSTDEPASAPRMGIALLICCAAAVVILIRIRNRHDTIELRRRSAEPPRPVHGGDPEPRAAAEDGDRSSSGTAQASPIPPAMPAARVDGEERALESALVETARRLAQGRVAVVFADTVGAHCNETLAKIAQIIGAKRYVALGAGEENPEQIRAIGGADARHVHELALAIAGRAHDVVVFVDTRVRLPEVALQQLAEVDCICLGAPDDQLSRQASVFLAVEKLEHDGSNRPSQTNAPTRVELLSRIEHRLGRVTAAESPDAAVVDGHVTSGEAPPFAPPPQREN